MMLSRTAANLFWTGRYLERADFVARLIEATLRFATLPTTDLDPEGGPWASALVTAGAADAFAAAGGAVGEEAVTRFLAFDSANPSSIAACLDQARQNARATRTALTAESWGAINDAWLDSGRVASGAGRADTGEYLERVKTALLIFNGALQRTQLRDDSYHFMSLGGAIERADNTARLLDVKYHLLLPEGEAIGGGLDYFQWSTILRTVGASTAYRWVYRAELKPMLVADLLIFNRRMPRSLASCADMATQQLDSLARSSGKRGRAHRLAGAMAARLGEVPIEAIFADGLHAFITEFLAENNALGHAVAEQYGF